MPRGGVTDLENKPVRGLITSVGQDSLTTSYTSPDNLPGVFTGGGILAKLYSIKAFLLLTFYFERQETWGGMHDAGGALGADPSLGAGTQPLDLRQFVGQAGAPISSLSVQASSEAPGGCPVDNPPPLPTVGVA